MRRRLLVSLACVVGFAAPALAVTEAHADFDLRVIWPTTREINPDQSSYQITISDTGPGTLEARWGASSTSLPHSGSVSVPLETDGDGRVEVWRCIAGVCDWAGVSSPPLRVHRSITVRTSELRIGNGAEMSTNVTISTVPQIGSVEISWRLVAGLTGDGSTVASGAMMLTPSSGAWKQQSYQAPITLTLPPTLVEGADYSWVVDVTEPFGADMLAGSSDPRTVMVDKTAPLITAAPDVSHLEPVVDGYLDMMQLAVTASEAVSARIDAYGPGGELLSRGSSVSIQVGSTAQFYWTGRRSNGTAYPPGDYRIDVVARDLFGNESTASYPVSLGNSELKYLTWQSAQLKPASGITEKNVGACAALKMPSATAGSGSLGYVSDATCYHHRTDDNLVWTQYRTKLPTSYRHRYRELLIQSLASGRSGRGTELITGPVTPAGSWKGSTVDMGSSLTWRQHKYPAPESVTQTASGWVMTWRAGTNYRSHVDVKRFRLALEYQVLMHPDGTWEIPVD